MNVTPVEGTNTIVGTAGSAVQALPANLNGGFITNPLNPTDQGQANPAVLYIDCVGLCVNCVANNTVVALQPGQTWVAISGQTTATYVNSQATGHKFTAVSW